MPSKYEWLAFGLLLIISGAVIYGYGQSRYDNGVSDQIAKQAKDNSKAQDDGRKSLESNQIKARNVDDIDAEFRKLGLLRP